MHQNFIFLAILLCLLIYLALFYWKFFLRLIFKIDSLFFRLLYFLVFLLYFLLLYYYFFLRIFQLFKYFFIFRFSLLLFRTINLKFKFYTLTRVRIFHVVILIYFIVVQIIFIPPVSLFIILKFSLLNSFIKFIITIIIIHFH